MLSQHRAPTTMRARCLWTFSRIMDPFSESSPAFRQLLNIGRVISTRKEAENMNIPSIRQTPGTWTRSLDLLTYQHPDNAPCLVSRINILSARYHLFLLFLTPWPWEKSLPKKKRRKQQPILRLALASFWQPSQHPSRYRHHAPNGNGCLCTYIHMDVGKYLSIAANLLICLH